MNENNENHFLSILDTEEIRVLKELPQKAICGYFTKIGNSPYNFEVNPEFIDILHNTIKSQGYKLNSLKEAAYKQGDGYVYIIDLRTKDGVMGDVPPEDIVGAFKVISGQIVSDDYFPNKNYKVYTDSGLIQLPKDLRQKLIDEISK